MKNKLFVLLLSCSFIHFSVSAQVYLKKEPLAHTYSIVARDEKTGDMAVAVQSHWFSVGTLVPWVEPGVGVVATQSFVNKSYGPQALSMLRKGYTPQQALDSLLKIDSSREMRQVAILDVKGNVAVHTGSKCIQVAKHIKGKNFSVQSNMMLGDSVCEYMKKAFELSEQLPFVERILLSLEAAQAAGGDIRGMQSAALLVVPGRIMLPWDKTIVDLRVDDAPQPLEELRRLYNMQLAYDHMNSGDLAYEKMNNLNLAPEKQDITEAMNEYNAAMQLFPDNLEMQFWTAVTLCNNKQMAKALPMLKKVFVRDKRWKELFKRLEPVGMLNISKEDMQKVMGL
jgi:uncharacterized Ntn-hydrolase superfamily protein